MEMLVSRPEIYIDTAGGKEWINLGDLAKLCSWDPANIWEEHCFIFAEGRNEDPLTIPTPIAPRMMIASSKTDDFFYMDSKGNVVDEDGQRTGSCVNGPPEKTVGDWEDIFVPKKWAEEVLDKERQDMFSREQMHPEAATEA